MRASARHLLRGPAGGPLRALELARRRRPGRRRGSRRGRERRRGRHPARRVARSRRHVRVRVDLDGDLDIASASYAGSSIATLRNCATPGAPFCAGDGTATACPCGNASTPGSDAGCLNSLGQAGRLRASGAASIANDSLVLTGTQMTNAAALYFQGTLHFGGGAGAVFGDGLRCVGGWVTRLKTVIGSGGASQVPQPGDPRISVVGGVMPGLRHYQAWYRNSASFCTVAGFNLTNGLAIVWHP